MVKQCMERFRQKQMKFEKLTQPGWKDTADYFSEIHNKYGTSESPVLVVVQLQTDDDAAAPERTTVR
jgi:hypothetical protein